MRQWGMFAGGSGCQELSPVGGRSAETLVLEGVSQQLYDWRQARSGHVQGKPREVKQYCSDKSIRE